MVSTAQGQKVLVNYAGYLRANGQLFDSNIKEVAQANSTYDQQREMGGGMHLILGNIAKK